MGVAQACTLHGLCVGWEEGERTDTKPRVAASAPHRAPRAGVPAGSPQPSRQLSGTGRTWPCSLAPSPAWFFWNGC